MKKGEVLGDIELGIPGNHNILNALAAIALADCCGAEFPLIARALSTFAGAKRRFETKYLSTNYRIVDDYGHHPSELAATLQTARSLKPQRLVVLFQPHRYTRTQALADDFGKVLQAADLVRFVFPISTPWSAATWDAISRLPARAMDRLVLIIQQADQRDPKDIQVILGHVGDLSMKRLGRVPPVFAVSGKLACDAKRVTPVAADLLQASGFPALENHISNTICLAPERRQALETWRAQVAAALGAVDDRIEDQSDQIKSHHGFVAQVEREIDGMRVQFVKRLPRHLAGVAEVFQSEADVVTKMLHRRLRALPSLIRLFTGDRTGPIMEDAFIGRLQSAVEAVAEQDGCAAAAACHTHWQNLGPRVESAMGINIHADAPIHDTLAAAKDRFVERLGRAAREGIGNLKVRNQLDKEVRRRNLALKSFTVMTLVLTQAGAVCGALNIPWIPYILCGLAGLFLSFGIGVAWATRAPITRDFRNRLLDTCGIFATTLHADYEEALRIVFQSYASSLDSLRSHLVSENHLIDPRLRRWQELFLTFKEVEQEL